MGSSGPGHRGPLKGSRPVIRQPSSPSNGPGGLPPGKLHLPQLRNMLSNIYILSKAFFGTHSSDRPPPASKGWERAERNKNGGGSLYKWSGIHFSETADSLHFYTWRCGDSVLPVPEADGKEQRAGPGSREGGVSPAEGEPASLSLTEDVWVRLWALCCILIIGHSSSCLPAGCLGGSVRWGQGGKCTASWLPLRKMDRLVTVLEYQGPEQRLEPGFS